MKRLSLLIVMVFCALGSAFAQRAITGTVTGPDGSPLIGASVLVKGTSVGTVTDFDGRYALSVPEGQNTIVISYTGYESQELALGASSVVNAVLAEGITLEAAVVTGLGIKREAKSLGYGYTRFPPRISLKPVITGPLMRSQGVLPVLPSIPADNQAVVQKSIFAVMDL